VIHPVSLPVYVLDDSAASMVDFAPVAFPVNGTETVLEYLDRNRVKYGIDNDNDRVEFPVSAHMEVCDRCNGTGTHDHPAFANGFTRDDDFVDDDFIEDYQAGMFDVTCSECNGRNVVAVPDWSAVNPIVQALANYVAAGDRQHRAECEAERRMGA
jgi:hypothetical protein